MATRVLCRQFQPLIVTDKSKSIINVAMNLLNDLENLLGVCGSLDCLFRLF